MVQGQGRAPSTSDPDHARYPGHPRRGDPPQRRGAADPNQALRCRRRRRPGRGRDAGGGPGARRRALVPPRHRGPARTHGQRARRWPTSCATATQPPRSRPRSEDTTAQPAHFALPALKSWASSTTRCERSAADDVWPPCRLPARPGPAWRRACGRSSGILKARKLVFVNPMFRIHVPAPDQQMPTRPTW